MKFIFILLCLINTQESEPYLQDFIKRTVTLAYIMPFTNEKCNTFVLIFLQISQLIWIKFSLLPQPVGLFKLIINLCCTIYIQMKKLNFSDFTNNVPLTTFVLHSDGYIQLSYKLGVVTDTTIFYILIPV